MNSWGIDSDSLTTMLQGTVGALAAMEPVPLAAELRRPLGRTIEIIKGTVSRDKRRILSVIPSCQRCLAT